MGTCTRVGMLILVHFVTHGESTAVLYNSYRDFKEMIFLVYPTQSQVFELILLR